MKKSWTYHRRYWDSHKTDCHPGGRSLGRSEQLARKLTREIYLLTKLELFSRDFGLLDQIRRSAGSSMHNIAEGFDGGSNAEFVKFLKYAQRSCTEVKSQLYVAIDQDYITQAQFDSAYELATATHRKIGGFIRYLINNPQPN